MNGATDQLVRSESGGDEDGLHAALEGAVVALDEVAQDDVDQRVLHQRAEHEHGAARHEDVDGLTTFSFSVLFHFFVDSKKKTKKTNEKTLQQPSGGERWQKGGETICIQFAYQSPRICIATFFFRSISTSPNGCGGGSPNMVMMPSAGCDDLVFTALRLFLQTTSIDFQATSRPSRNGVDFSCQISTT